MYTKYVQLGGTQRCHDNGVPRWEYCIGYQNSKIKNRFSSHYIFTKNKSSSSSWRTEPKYSTTFTLLLIR